MTGYSGTYWLSNRRIPKCLVFHFNLFTPFFLLSFIPIFCLSDIRFTLPLYLLYIHHSTILITLSRSYHARLRVSYTYTFLSYVYLLLLPL